MTFIRKTKRKPLACVQCRLRKVRCDKQVPCKNCLTRGFAKQCHREVVLVRDTVANRDSGKYGAVGGLFSEFEIENIRMCVEKLTFGFIKVDRLFKSERQREVNWPLFHNDLASIMARVDHATSHCLCSFASSYINFIHNAVVPSVFIDEHETFWNEHVKENPACLVYSKYSSLQSDLPRDYYFWMALYYGTLCNGIYFGSEQLKDELKFTSCELQTLGPKLFTAALDCLYRAQFMSYPDIRAIQVFCLLSTCFHAYGSVSLSQALLIQCIRIARKLGIDSSKTDSGVTFSSEIKRRLWYTLCLNDWLDQIDKPRFYIETTDLELPSLLTDEHLLHPESSGKVQFNDYSSVYYQRTMVSMALIKKRLFEKQSSELDTLEAWNKMNELRDSTISFYQKILEPTNDGILGYDYAKFLLFSSLSEELLDLGRRVLAIVGKQTWSAKYRSVCLEAALGNMRRAISPIPSYYRRHWIVTQHLIYAALTILLDMIMFPNLDSKKDKRSRLEQVESTFQVFEELEATHLPAKLGIALLPRLCKLVRFVIVDQRDGNTFEVESLKSLLDDLQFGISPDVDAVPAKTRPQYLRFGLPLSSSSPGTRSMNRATNYTDSISFDDEILKFISDTGWSEVLMNIFQPATSPP